MEFSHIDEQGRARMVDVGSKEITIRTALAKGKIYVSQELMGLIKDSKVPKGDIFSTSRIAGIMAAKGTSSLIPMCHPLMLSAVEIDFLVNDQAYFIEVSCKVSLSGKTGVEMEALTGVSIALLTIYDMCKAVDKSMKMEDIRLIQKTGGKTGTYERIEE